MENRLKPKIPEASIPKTNNNKFYTINLSYTQIFHKIISIADIVCRGSLDWFNLTYRKLN
ncbi:hypothetical protein LBC_03610 [Campylobacter sp. 19-13652]|nr:hypothetical protein LBC_03610 [Campylobacter sp. 19-13652]